MGLKLTKKIYVRIYIDKDTEFYDVSPDPAELVAVDETNVILGEYQFVKKVKATNKTTIK